MDGIEILIKSLETKIRALFGRLDAGLITPAQWYELMGRLVGRYSLAALMVGLGRSDLSRNDMLVSWESMSGQLEYLDAFKAQIQSAPEFKAGWESRAASYAKAIKVPYWRGRTKMLPLPAMPAQGTQCMNNCGCLWRIETINEKNGDYDCYWERHKDDSCQTCIERERQWNPLLIRGGVLVNPFVKEYIDVTLKHLAGQHDQKRHSWRYGPNVPLSRLKRQKKTGGDSEWNEYKNRARAKHGTAPAKSKQPPKPVVKQTRAQIVADKLRAIGKKFNADEKEAAYIDAVKKNNAKVAESNALFKQLKAAKASGDEALVADLSIKQKQASKECETLLKEAKKRRKEWETEKDAISFEYAAALRVDDPISLSYDMDKIGKDRAADFEKTIGAVSGMVSQKTVPTHILAGGQIPHVQITSRGPNRAQYRPADRIYQEGGWAGKYKKDEKGLLVYGPQVAIKSGGNAVLAHELGHHLEMKVPGMEKKVQDFYDKRTMGESLQSLKKIYPQSNFAWSEVTKVDKFINPYMGRKYAHGGSEIVSMGIQYLLHDPIALLNGDPDYFNFMIDLLQGE